MGRHISEMLAHTSYVYLTSRTFLQADSNVIQFDLQSKATWEAILDIRPDVIINASGYGVVKEQVDLSSMYEINYQAPLALAMYLQKSNQYPLWIQIGSAFEYDLDAECLTEDSDTVPTTHYGISKLLFSNFLKSSKNKLPYVLLRPFAMYGPYENQSKIIPYLINAQKNKQKVSLSSGLQKRDYLYVKDLAAFVKMLLKGDDNEFNGQVYNLGSGKAVAIKDLAQVLSSKIPGFDAEYWAWGHLSQRSHESETFFNGSTKALSEGLTFTSQSEAIQETVDYYFNLI